MIAVLTFILEIAFLSVSALARRHIVAYSCGYDEMNANILKLLGMDVFVPYTYQKHMSVNNNSILVLSRDADICRVSETFAGFVIYVDGEVDKYASFCRKIHFTRSEISSVEFVKSSAVCASPSALSDRPGRSTRRAHTASTGCRTGPRTRRTGTEGGGGTCGRTAFRRPRAASRPGAGSRSAAAPPRRTMGVASPNASTLAV